ncbi:hypothetical protein F2P81_000031 [Scophthalmus maximus]|uniref:EGF-like domain-containing protein n=1 Tax=Scophthalmus maximus TaxID=52904 RepID=A0A6A4TPU0_SCOMX|nr:hypothetical protein F2P81_000031 [Scophthalmus maximus]
MTPDDEGSGSDVGKKFTKCSTCKYGAECDEDSEDVWVRYTVQKDHQHISARCLNTTTQQISWLLCGSGGSCETGFTYVRIEDGRTALVVREGTTSGDHDQGKECKPVKKPNQIRDFSQSSMSQLAHYGVLGTMPMYRTIYTLELRADRKSNDQVTECRRMKMFFLTDSVSSTADKEKLGKKDESSPFKINVLETTGLDHGDGFYAGMPIPCGDSHAGFCVHGKCEIKYNMATCRCDSGYKGSQCDEPQDFNILYVVPSGQKLHYVLIAAIIGAVQIAIIVAVVMCITRKCPKNNRGRRQKQNLGHFSSDTNSRMRGGQKTFDGGKLQKLILLQTTFVFTRNRAVLIVTLGGGNIFESTFENLNSDNCSEKASEFSIDKSTCGRLSAAGGLRSICSNDVSTATFTQKGFECSVSSEITAELDFSESGPSIEKHLYITSTAIYIL